MAPRRWRRTLGALVALAVLVLAASPAQATLLPPGFFDQAIKAGQGAAAVEADRLSYDSRRDIISAEGNVMLSYQGYQIRADRVEFNQRSSALKASGNVVVRDRAGNSYAVDSLDITGGLKEAFLNSLTITTSKGATITARDAHYSEALATVLTDAAYSPCGLCTDSRGRTIGWKIKAARIIYDRDKASVTLEQPSLELLGVPVAWLPWFWIPDPTQPRATGFRMPSVDFDAQRGAALTVPYFVPAGPNADITLSPTLMSRQGLLLGTTLDWRLPPSGEIEVSASGLYQLDPGAFAGTVGDRPWRGAIQTSGHFVPAANWTAGWSWSAFTDNAYLTDYKFTDADMLTNELYATHLSADTWFDARLQSFHRLGNFGPADDAEQALVLPQLTYDHVQDLAPGWGRLHLSGELLDVSRAEDQTDSFNGVPYGFGLEGNKQHLMLEGAWENQFILPAGVAVTPYLGIRLDAANYDGASSYAGPPGAPPASMLLSATPIAALDMRWPLMASNGADTHLFEPIAQVVYRGSATTAVGITNDDAQSFVFDDTNLFSYNRFSGIDRQETGLRANIGGHYLGNFGDGSWLDFIAGQSFQLAGLNALGVSDPAQTGTSTGLGSTASFIVAGARGGFSNGLTVGAKLQVDPATPRVTRAGLGVDYAPGNRFSAGADYVFVAADPALGVVSDQHEIATRVGVPVSDYWTLDAGFGYDIAAMNWLKVSAGATYDDGYLLYGASANATPTSWGVGLKFQLKGPDHQAAY